MKGGRKQSWTALTQAQKAERRPAQSQQLKWKEQHIQARALKLQAQMMDSRKGGTPTGRRPDGGSTGVFCIKKQYAGILSANESGVSKLKEKSKFQRTAGSAACYSNSDVATARHQRRSVDTGDGGTTRREGE